MSPTSIDPPSQGSGDSSSEDEIPMLPSDTLALVSSFLAEQQETARGLAQLATQVVPGVQNGGGDGCLFSPDDIAKISPLDHSENGLAQPAVGLAEWRKLFKEDWSLSQFWYDDETAFALGRVLLSVCTPATRVAFLCSPTAFVGFTQLSPPASSIYLFEFDKRFSLLCPSTTSEGSSTRTQFIHYDFNDPLSFHEEAQLKGTMDLVLVDPPYLNETTHSLVAQTAAYLLRPSSTSAPASQGPAQGGKLLLLTGLSMSPHITTVWDREVGTSTDEPGQEVGTGRKMRRTNIRITHEGNRLKNDFALWISWDPRTDGVCDLELVEEHSGVD